MKCFLSNSIAEARASQLLLRLFQAISAILLLAGVAGTAAGQDFTLRTDPLTDPALVEALEASIDLDQRAEAGLLEPDAPTMVAAVASERARLRAIMEGFGYLDAEVDWDFDPRDESHELRPVAGPQYRIGAVALSLLEVSDPARPGDLEAIAESVIAQLIDDLVHRIEASGFPFVRLTTRELTPDPQTGLALVRLALDPGRPAAFGAVTLDRARAFTMDRLHELLPFSIGDRYAPDQIDALRAALAIEPGLRSARVTITEDAEDAGRLTVAVSVRETIADALLNNRSAAGQGALLAVLAFLALRQVTIAAGGPAHSALVQSQTILSMIAMAAAAWFVVRRFIDFAGIG
jgi:hypothetical protein